MKKTSPRKQLPQIISGVWILNVAGVLILCAFIWYENKPMKAEADSFSFDNQPSFSLPALVTATPTTLQADFPAAQTTAQISESPELPTPSLDPSATQENPIVIGYSVAGRPIEVYRYGTGTTGRLIVAGIHGGNEYNTTKLARELMAYIDKHHQVIPENITLYILPSLNPDGEARAHTVDGRVNDHGVDLNRNWPYKWVKDYDRSSCWHYRLTSAGDYGASEPETASLLIFIVSHPEIDGLISYHSAALGIFAGGVPEFKPSIRLAESLAKVSTYRYPPKDIGCIYTGNLTDWAANTQGIAGVDIELHDFKHTDFDENLRVLKVFLGFKNNR
jgi:hypothetical protein